MDLCLLSNNKTPIVFCGTDQVTVTRSSILLANLSYTEPAERALVLNGMNGLADISGKVSVFISALK